MRSPEQVRISDVNLRNQEFVRYQRHLLEGGEDLMMALQRAQSAKSSERVVNIIRAAVQAGSTIPADDWGDALVPHASLSEGYLSSLTQLSLFDAAVGGMITVPLNPPTRIAVATAALVGEVVGERAPRAISAASFRAEGLATLEASAICIVSEEMLRFAAGVENILNSELKVALALAMNQHFVAAITPTGSPDPSINSSGDDASHVYADLRSALDLLDIDQLSKLVIALPPLLAARLSLLDGTDGAPAFPLMTPQGGTIASMRAVPTDALADDEVIVLDAHAFAGNPGEVMVDSAAQATIQFDDSPDDPPDATTIMQSLWQTNRRALRLRRRFGFQQLRGRSVARITSVTWGA
jgi:hypothetical protein